MNIKVEVPAMQFQGSGVYSTLGNPNFGSSPGNRWEYTGAFSNPDLTYDGIPVTQYADGGGNRISSNPLLPSIAEWESRAWNIRPQLERASLFNFLYEFKDVPQMLRQTANGFRDLWKQVGGDPHTPFMHPKRAADEFLGLQFGWIPFVSDISRLCEAVIFSEQFVHDLSVNNNTWVKRKQVLANVVDSTRIKRLYSLGCEPSGFQIQGLCRDMVLDGVTCKGYMDVFEDKTDLVWAEGSFKYYRPEFDMSSENYNSVFNRFQQSLTVLGLRVNPTHIWRSLPWSWAVDWFSNIGDNIAAFDAIHNDSTVANYLYVMRHQIRNIRSFHLLNFWSGALALQWARRVESKQRRTADSPYGFALGGDLSATQWSILAALGLSRNVSFTRRF